MADDGEGPKRRKARRKQVSRRRRSNRPQSTVLVSLSHPLRRRILRILLDRGEERSPVEMALEIEGPLGRIAYHIEVLRRLGALKVTDEPRERGAGEHFYETTIEDDPSIESLLDETRLEDEEDE